MHDLTHLTDCVQQLVSVVPVAVSCQTHTAPIRGSASLSYGHVIQ